MLYTVLYAIVFAISVIMLIAMVSLYGSHRQKYHIFISVLIMVSNFGHLLRAIGYINNESLMFFADRFVYVDGTLLLSFFVLLSLYFAKVKIPKALTAVIIILGSLEYLLMCSEKWVDWVIRHPHLESTPYGNVFRSELGPLYIAVIVYMVLCLGTIFACVLRSVRHPHIISFKYSLTMFINLLMTVLILAVQYYCNISIKLLPFSYLITEFFLFYIMYIFERHEINENSINDIMSRADVVNIAFDFDRKYLGVEQYNSSFKVPDIASLTIDRPVPKTATFINGVLFNLLDSYEREEYEPLIYTEGKLKYEISIRDYYTNLRKAPVGYLFTIKEDTKRVNTLERESAANEHIFELDNMVNALCGIYVRVSYFDLREDTFIRLKGPNDDDQTMVTLYGTQKQLNANLKRFITEQNKNTVREFANLGTVANRLKDTDTISLEVQSADKKQWVKMQFTVSERDDNGNAEKLFYTVLDITDKKKHFLFR